MLERQDAITIVTVFKITCASEKVLDIPANMLQRQLFQVGLVFCRLIHGTDSC